MNEFNLSEESTPAMNAYNSDEEQPLVFTVADLQRLLGVSKPVALKTAHALGVRLPGSRRIVIPRARLEEFLSGGGVSP